MLLLANAGPEGATDTLDGVSDKPVPQPIVAVEAQPGWWTEALECFNKAATAEIASATERVRTLLLRAELYVRLGC